ncbi:MAG: endonuclease III domain-containing protein [Myxococcota bacterium]
MKRQEKADRIGEILDDLYPETPIPLDHSDAYTLLVAVLLSAQTTDERVNMVTPDLFSLADNPYDMAELEVDEILGAIRSCGLAPTKAKRIKKLSQILLDDYDGDVPGSLADMKKLPGVGHKTASVVMSQWFGEPSFPVDTHIHRLGERWGLSNGKNVKKTEKDLKKVFDRDTWNRRHLQIIFFGREYCPARGHEPDECPICEWAMTKKMKKQERAK